MKINQVAKKFNVPEHTLRYWESIRIIPKVRKDSQGYREYTTYDINQIKFVILMRNSGVGIKLLINI